MRWLTTLSLCCAAIGASAQEPETVLVEKDRGLAGLWQVAVPESVGVNLFQSAKFGPMRLIYWRIGETLDIHCLNGGYSRSGTISANGDAVHIAWGTAMARFVIDGMRVRDTVAGTFAFKLSGVSHDDPAPSTSARFFRTESDAGGKTAYLSALMNQLADGKVIVAHDDAAIAKNEGALPTNIGALGGVLQIVYLGTSPKLGGGGGADFFSVYAVEFERAERICGLHQRNDGTLDAFACV